MNLPAEDLTQFPEEKVDRKKLDQFVIYVPAFNAASTLPKVIERIPKDLVDHFKEILVIDNHSQDNTHLVAVGLKHLNDQHNLEIVRNEENLGYGGSQKKAYSRCIENGVKGVVMLHGDAQYAPELVGDLLKPIMDGEADMVFGSRMNGDPLKGGMPYHRYLGNKFLTGIQNFFLGTKITEFHSGYRVFSIDALKKVHFDRLSSDFHFDTEMLILFVHNKLRISEKPIPTYYGDEKNYVNIWSYGINVLVTTITYFFHMKRWRHSKRWAKILD